RLQPEDAALESQLAQARAALIAQGDAALIEGDADLDALRMAQRRAAVLRKLWPADADVLAYLARVDRSERAWDRNARGEALLDAGQLGEDGSGALADFRAAQAAALTGRRRPVRDCGLRDSAAAGIATPATGRSCAGN
ncbi:MAG: hypothetical protein ABIP16_08930, partial [Thermomonas sp.]